MALFEVENLSFCYPESEKKALDSLNITIEKGDFIAICGKSGCGKSTLLRHFKTVLTPHGKRDGEILFHGAPVEKADLKEQSSKIGYVLQSPENQIVTDKVWHELAFGLESLGFDNETIRVRVAEMTSFFGIQTWFNKSVTELSGGQKQILNLASIMAMQPEVLILDEPTSQLDPIAASDFLSTVKKINREIGTTIIITEHRLEEIFTMADRVIVMDKAKIIADAPPSEVGALLKATKHEMFAAMPSPMQIYSGVLNDQFDCPITVRDGRKWLDMLLPDGDKSHSEMNKAYEEETNEVVVEVKNVWFRYDKASEDVVKDLAFSVQKGQLYAIVGGNGTGKTTSLSIVAGIYKPYRGKVMISGKNLQKMSSNELFRNNLGMLPQNPQALFVHKTVELDLYEILSDSNLSKQEQVDRVTEVAKLVEIEDLLSAHPYDLSGGEQQRAAFAKVLLLNPKIMLLDEPTKGLDAYFKITFARILKRLQNNGVTIIMVSHDIEFCAKYADVCAMFFDGNIVTSNTPEKFFTGNSFYTTAANRMARHIFPNAITVEDVINLCNQNLQ
ncbi:MAG: energy-coupling factor transporter ATPase [Oscillospiraceae bacterium]